MKNRRLAALLLAVVILGPGKGLRAAEPATNELFARKNLVAWCIVPFDSKKRGPEERAAMLERLGFTKFAYDYRAEHIPTFDAEIEALKKHHVELTAWWFPTSLNDEAKQTLALFAKHKVTPQLWVTGGGGPTRSAAEQQQRVIDEAARIRPIAEAAAKVGCKVALYNHGGWFGEPENQMAIIEELKLPNVGIVYNQHHGHDHVDRFPELLQKMLPHLYLLNLNGMVREGDRKGQKILPLGQGDLDPGLLTTIRNSGYAGPIGILGHTDDDAEARLHDNLDGLDWLLPQLAGKAAEPKPKMRTPVPAAQVPAAAVPPNANAPRVVDGKFGQGLNGPAGRAVVAGRDEFHKFPITVDCWTRLTDKGPYNILIANETKASGTHWELFSMAGNGNFTVYVPGFKPDHCHSSAMICDGKWHHVAMVLEPERIRLFVDGQPVANQVHQRTEMKSAPGELALAGLVEQGSGCTGVLDEVRISSGFRAVSADLGKPADVDETTLALWHLNEVTEQKRFEDATKKSPALIGQAASPGTLTAGNRQKIEGHWGEEALGFRWTEDDSRDDRLGQMDTGPFFSGSITGPGGTVYKGIVVRVGAKRTASICYDTELMRASAGWTGFLKFDAARYGIIVPPRIHGDLAFSTPLFAGWSRHGEFSNFREANPYGPLPKAVAHYEGLYRHGERVVLKFTVGDDGSSDSPNERLTVVLESPWLEDLDGTTVLTRTLLIAPAKTPLSMLVTDGKGQVRLVAHAGTAALKPGPQASRILVVPPHTAPVTVKLLIATATIDDIAFDKVAAASPAADDLAMLSKPGPAIWGEPLVTVGDVAPTATSGSTYVVDTITLPFDNPFRALMFCGGHDFLPDGRAAVCTLHGDVWLVDGIDETLARITWRRFATGLFQPLGVKIVSAKVTSETQPDGTTGTGLFVVGRDQITRLHDLNQDGEADFYENFNNDAHVSLNGHEYVTSLETDRAGNFFFVKGNCDSATPHDGSLLRVSRDGSRLDVYATGFRNSNGIGIGPNDEITVAPQEGEWTPASAVFAVRQGGFYGGMMSHHRATPPTDFERPFCWFPRLADNSCGGQVWVTSDRWGPLRNELLHLSYGQCKLRLLVQEKLPPANDSSPDSTPPVLNGGSTELPLTFASGIHRGRFNPEDGQLYVTGLKGWVSSAVNDGCFQRVRYTGQPLDAMVAMKSYRNGIALTFTRPLDRKDAEDLDNYQLEAWNYRWSAEYGSPDLRPSAPGQVGRDAVEPKSVTLLADNRTLFIELPDLKPVDQLGVSFSLHATDGATVEQTAYLTLNGISNDVMPTEKLHRSAQDVVRAELLARLSPGVLLTAPSLSDPRQSRLMAWRDPHGSGPTKELVATGYLKIPATGDYRFSTQGETTAKLEIDDQAYPLGNQEITVRLRRGFSTFRVHDFAPAHSSDFRMMWESDRFPREAVPATALFHEREVDATFQHRQQFLAGRILFANHQCGRCHVHEHGSSQNDLTATLVEQERHAPQLDGVGARIDRDWLAAWLRDPAHLRADATMPSLPGTQSDSALSDLLAYLVSLPAVNNDPQRPLAEPVDTAQLPQERGAELFERLGCIACHTFAAADADNDWNRVSLQFVKAKYRPGQLKQFLLAPQRHHIGSLMPDFRLSEAEATTVAAYLEHHSKGTLKPFVATPAGDPRKGSTLFTELRCDRCHLVSAVARLVPPNVRPAFNRQAQYGCLAEPADRSPIAPVYAWNDTDRDALRQYLTAIANQTVPNDPGTDTRLPRLLASLRCNACHARDAKTSTWPEIVAEEGSGRLPEAIPQLTWVGEKLQGPWIEKLLNGELPQKPRPWLTARMPGFPAYAAMIAQAMSEEHGVPFFEPLPQKLDAQQIEMGRLLTLRDGGLDCRQCHGLGKEQPRGDAATQIAPGINFAVVPDRLRPEFALRQMLDPPRYDIGSRMPRFAPDLRTTAAKQIAGGDARQQFEAIKEYLWSLKSAH